MKSTFEYIVRALVDFFTRRRSIGFNLIRLGVVLLIAMSAGIVLQVNLPTAAGPLVVSVNTTDGLGAAITLVIIALAFLLILAGYLRLRAEDAVLARKRVFVIELRGLRDWNGPPLSASVPNRLEGRRDDVAVDLRQRVRDGVIVDPDAAVERLTSLRSDLDTRESNLDRNDVHYVFGGLASVPLTFLAGVIVDDETPITIMDWDRQAREWRELNADDDGERFAVEGLDVLAPGAPTAALAVSASYAVDLAGVQLKYPDLPLVQLRFADASTTRHWSEKKQQALAQQFLDVCQALAAKGVRTIHMFFAGPSSLVFRFGTHYDKRNLPRLIVHQFEQNSAPPFPWGVEMPVAGKVKAEVVR